MGNSRVIRKKKANVHLEMWTCQEGLALGWHTGWESPGSTSPSLPACPPTLWLVSCCGGTWPGSGHGSRPALLGQALWPRAGYPATAGEGGLAGVGLPAGKMWGMGEIGTEEEPRLILVHKGQVWMKRSRVNGARTGQSSGVAESTLSNQGPEQVTLPLGNT